MTSSGYHIACSKVPFLQMDDDDDEEDDDVPL